MIELSKHQAETLRASFAEIEQLEAHPVMVAVQVKREEVSRLIRLLVQDADQPLEEYRNVGLWEDDGKVYLKPKEPSPQLAPQPSTKPAPKPSPRPSPKVKE
jgi:hypothetical protein